MNELDPSAAARSPSAPQWHLHIPPETYGPYSLQQLRDYAREGRMNADTLVWSEGADGWTRAGDQAALRALFGSAAPARPTPPAVPAASPARAAVSASPYVLGASGALSVSEAGGAVVTAQNNAFTATQNNAFGAPPTGPRMGFGEAVRTCLMAKYIVFQGRAPRAEFWWFGLFVFIVTAVVYSITGWLAFASSSEGSMSIAGYLALAIAALIVLAFAIPGIAVSVRRLHDLGWSGWWYLAQFIPVVGGIVALVMFIGFMMRGNVGPNRFGPDPLADSL